MSSFTKEDADSAAELGKLIVKYAKWQATDTTDLMKIYHRLQWLGTLPQKISDNVLEVKAVVGPDGQQTTPTKKSRTRRKATPKT